MSLPSNYVGVAGDRCSCGRRASIRHCPQCGSFRVNIHRDKNGGKESPIEGFLCIRCGAMFDDSDRKSCDAPVYRTKSDMLAFEFLRARQEQKDQHPLTEREKTLLEALDPLTHRFRHDEEQPPEVGGQVINMTDEVFDQAKSLDSKVLRKLAMEYATLCLKQNIKATPEGREAFIAQRIKESQQ